MLCKASIAVGLEAADARIWVLPRRVICLGGAEVVRRMASRKRHEDPMTKPKSRPKASSRSTARRAGESAPRKRSAAASPQSAAGRDTKHARILAMLRRPAGATIASIAAATEWKQHSVRGFLAGVVRKKLGLNLVSEQTDKGRVYRKDGKAAPVAAIRAQQAG
jgi:hypothetical protein